MKPLKLTSATKIRNYRKRHFQKQNKGSNPMMKTRNLIPGIGCMVVMFFFTTLLQAQETSEVRELKKFNSIEAGSIFAIEVMQSEEQKVEVFSDNVEMEDIGTEVSNNTLELDYNGKARNAQIKVVIQMAELRNIDLGGAASLKTSGKMESPEMEISLSGAAKASMVIETTTLTTDLGGAADLKLVGVAQEHISDISGAAQLRAEELETQRTLVETSGASYAKIFASEEIKADASGTSRIAFDNEPKVQTLNTSGMASVSGKSTTIRNNESFTTDTTKISIGKRDFIVVDEENDDDEDETKKRRKSFTENWSGFDLGINGYLSPSNSLDLQSEAQPVNLRYERSLVFNLNVFQQSLPIVSDRLGFYTGLGIGWNNYRFDNQTVINYDEDEGISFERDTINNIKRNKLMLTYLNVPLMLEFQNNGKRDIQDFHLAAGMTVGTRIGTRVKYVFDEDGDKRKEKDLRDFHVQPFRFDATARIGWGNLNFFATYALNSLFTDDKGPELYPFTVGIRVVSFD